MSYQNFQMRQIWFVDVRNEIKIQSSHQGEVNAQTVPVTFHWKVLRLFVYEGMKWSGERRVKVGGCGRSRNKLTGKYVKSQTHSIGWYYAPTPECFLNKHGLLMAPNGLYLYWLQPYDFQGTHMTLGLYWMRSKPHKLSAPPEVRPCLVKKN